MKFYQITLDTEVEKREKNEGKSGKLEKPKLSCPPVRTTTTDGPNNARLKRKLA